MAELDSSLLASLKPGDRNSGGRSLSLILQKQTRIQSCDPLIRYPLFFGKCACFTGLEELFCVDPAE